MQNIHISGLTAEAAVKVPMAICETYKFKRSSFKTRIIETKRILFLILIQATKIVEERLKHLQKESQNSQPNPILKKDENRRIHSVSVFFQFQ